MFVDLSVLYALEKVWEEFATKHDKLKNSLREFKNSINS